MIAIKYIWDEELAIKSAEVLYKHELNNSRKRFIGWLFIAIVQFGVVGALKHHVYGLLVLGTVGIVYWYILRWPLRKYFIKKTFQKSPFANQTINLLAKDDGIYKDEVLQIPYDSIKDSIEFDDGVLIYYHNNNIYLPKISFKNQNIFNKFCIHTKGCYK